MSDDLSEQEDEILALESILNLEQDQEENHVVQFRRCDSEASSSTALGFGSGRLRVSPVLTTSPINVKCASEEPEAASDRLGSRPFLVHHLPPFSLQFCYPPDYPSKAPPTYSLSCPWLSTSQLEVLSARLDSLWEENEGSVVLFLWYHFLSEEAMEAMGVEQEVDLSAMVESEFQQRREKEEKHKPAALNANATAFTPTGSSFKVGTVIRLRPKTSDGFIRINDKTADEQDINFTLKSVMSFPEGQSTVNEGDRVMFELPDEDSIIVHVVQSAKKVQTWDSTFVPPVVKLLKEFNGREAERVFDRTCFECLVCFSEKLGKECIKFTGCGHVYCKTCMTSHFRVKLDEGCATSLSCPTKDCDTRALPDQVRRLLPPALYVKYEKLLLEITLETMVDVMACPLRHCQCPTIIDHDMRMGCCPNCSFAFCIYCKATYHGVDPCRVRSKEKKALIEAYMKAEGAHKIMMEKRYGAKHMRHMADEYLSDIYKEDHSQKCPSCGTHIEKTEGCNKMVCNKCGCNFCYLCGARCPRANPYSHFNVPGSNCANRLFEGIDPLDDGEFDMFEDFGEEMDPMFLRALAIQDQE